MAEYARASRNKELAKQAAKYVGAGVVGSAVYNKLSDLVGGR